MTYLPCRDIPQLNRGCIMEGAVKERWLELCELASKEQDPKELVKLVEEINRLLEEKKHRLRAKRTNQP